MSKLLVTGTLVLSLLSACGGSPAASPAPAPAAAAASPAPAPGAAASPSAAPETVDARIARLYEAAKVEGKVAAYWSLNTQFANPLIAKFQARFPGVTIQHTRAASQALVLKVLTEKKAGQDFVDVVEMEAFDMSQLITPGYTQAYRVASFQDFPAAARGANDAWIAVRLNNDYPGFNTTKIKPGEVKTWKDLCDKKYEGHIAVDRDQVAIYSALRKTLGETEAKAIITCIAANKPQIRTGNTEMAGLMAAGEFWATFSTHAPAMTPLKYENKLPVDLVVTNPVLTYMQTIALASKAPHPNAARLFMEWMTSEGQQALADIGQAPASSRAKTKYPELGAVANAFYITPELAADFGRDAEFWNTAFKVK